MLIEVLLLLLQLFSFKKEFGHGFVETSFAEADYTINEDEPKNLSELDENEIESPYAESNSALLSSDFFPDVRYNDTLESIDTMENYLPKKIGENLNNYIEFYDYFEDLAKDADILRSGAKKRSIFRNRAYDFQDFAEERSSLVGGGENSGWDGPRPMSKGDFIYDYDSNPDVEGEVSDYSDAYYKSGRKGKRFTKHTPAAASEMYATRRATTKFGIINSRNRGKNSKQEKQNPRTKAVEGGTKEKWTAMTKEKQVSQKRNKSGKASANSKTGLAKSANSKQSTVLGKPSSSLKQSKVCHPPAGPPKFTWYSEGSEDAKGKEYEDMLKGKVAERIVKVIHAKVCKSPKLSTYFGNCKKSGSGSDSKDAKDSSIEECNSLFKPETVKEIMNALEKLDPNENCHQLPAKLHEFLQWLIKVKRVRYISVMKKSQPFCSQYSNCTRAESAFLFHDYGVSPVLGEAERHQGVKEIQDGVEGCNSADPEMPVRKHRLLARNERAGLSYEWLEENDVLMPVSESQAGMAIDGTTANYAIKKFIEDTTVALRARGFQIHRSPENFTANNIEGSIGFDTPMVVNVPEYDYL